MSTKKETSNHHEYVFVDFAHAITILLSFRISLEI
jgi:hypothetical protein